jgi:hypothetical protein
LLATTKATLLIGWFEVQAASLHIITRKLVDFLSQIDALKDEQVPFSNSGNNSGATLINKGWFQASVVLRKLAWVLFSVKHLLPAA